jgi:hypothetical protein
MARIITILLCGVVGSLAMTSSLAQRTGNPEEDARLADRVVQRSGNVLKIAEDAPARYVVKRGDTLWGISTRYLSDPWRWPELWRGNKDQIKDPHWIYPGDVLILDRAAGTLTLERDGRPVTQGRAQQMQTPSDVVRLQPTARAEPLENAIPVIPANAIEPYLARPLVLDARVVGGRLEEAEGLRDAPRLLGAQEGRVMLGTGDRAFVTGMKSDALNWHVFRSGRRLIDPVTNELLGVEAIQLGTVRVIRRGEPAEVLIESVKQEILPGDRLMPAERQPLTNFTLRRPDREIEARVLSIYGAVETGGQYSIVTLNRGKRDGLELGNVLAIYHALPPLADKQPDGSVRRVALPDERYGLVTVFRIADRVSYALVMEVTRPLAAGDALRNP